MSGIQRVIHPSRIASEKSRRMLLRSARDLADIQAALSRSRANLSRSYLVLAAATDDPSSRREMARRLGCSPQTPGRLV